jgi:cobalt-zinc-cadmium efflux system outer membrane protein
MKILTTIFVIFGGFSAALAQEASPANEATNAVVISTEFINRLVEEARTNNPALRAAGSRVKAATLNAGTIRTWEDPMATFGVSIFSSSGFDPRQEGDLVYGVEEKLPLWGRPELNRRIAGTEVSMRQAEVGLRLQETRRDIAKGLLATAFAERMVEIGEQDLAWLNVTAKAVENKYRAGEAVLADTLQIENEAAKRNDELLTDRHRLAHERFALNRLLNRSADSPWPSLRLPPAGPVIPLSQKLLTLALQNEPKLKLMEQEIKGSQATAELTRKSRLPDLSLGVEGRQFSGDGGFREGDFTLRFSLPWFNGDKYRQDYERDKEKQKSAEQERENQALTVREELHHLSVEIEASHRQALLYGGEIATRASQALSSRLADWETGPGMVRDVLDARRMLLESELRSAQATAEQNEMLAELLLWTGLDSVEALVQLADEPAITHDHEVH